MLSGDSEDVCKKVSDELGLDGYYASLLPEEKMNKLDFTKTGNFYIKGHHQESEDKLHVGENICK